LKQWVLVLTNSSDATADFLLGKLAQSSIAHVRLDTDAFVETARLTATESDAKLYFGGECFSPESFSHIWLRRPLGLTPKIAGDPGASLHLEKEWAAALEGWLARIPRERWINHPLSNGAASCKVEQLWRAKRAGLEVPPSLVTQSREEAHKFFEANNGSVVVKAIHGGYIERTGPQTDTVIYTHAITPNEISLFPADKACPTLLQRRVEKKCDVRITIVDQALHAIALIAPDESGAQRLDIRREMMAGVTYTALSVPAAVETALRRYVASYQLRFAAIDMVLDEDDQWIFLELNPNGQWAWLDQCGASDIGTSFINSFRR
jgi:hypothetical protein